MSAEPLLSGWRYRALILSIVLSALGYLGFSLWGGWQAVSNAVVEVGVIGIAFALLMSSLNYLLRFMRWQSYLRAVGHPIAFWPSLQIYLAGFALTTTPGKAGEALRGVLLKPLGVPYPQSFAAFFSERLSDLIGVVLLSLFGLTLYPDAQPLIAISAGLILLGFVVLSQRRLIEWLQSWFPKSEKRLARLIRHLLQIVWEAQNCHRPALLLSATLLSTLAWGAEAVAFHWLLNLMGADVSLSFAVFVYALSMLAGALSFMPGGLGGAEAVMVGLLVWKGMPNGDAVAATVLIRLATLWYAVAIGGVLLARLRTRVVTVAEAQS